MQVEQRGREEGSRETPAGVSRGRTRDTYRRQPARSALARAHSGAAVIDAEAEDARGIEDTDSEVEAVHSRPTVASVAAVDSRYR